ncbi:MAG TPA: class I SAM-dependent methyltransferase [Acidimicrobiales bacterium]
MAEPSLLLAPGRDRSLGRRHPWVFAGAVARVEGQPVSGDTVAVRSSDGRFLAWAAYSPLSQIVARAWSWDHDEKVDEAFFAARVERAAAARSDLADRTDAVRLVFAESDGLPGVIADRYDSFVVLQLSSAGADRWRDALTAAFAGLPGVVGVYERSDLDVRHREGLAPRTGLLAGEHPPDSVTIVERPPAEGAGWSFVADLIGGHKTGFYLDQRENRRIVSELAEDRRVLDLFAYTGGFSVAAAAGGAAELTSVDSSGPALALAAKNLERNGFTAARLVEADVFSHLRLMRDRAERFDLIVADPPKLAHNTSQLKRATRAYKDLNLLSLKLLAPGGVLVTCSCSGLMSEDLFQKVLFGAAIDAGREAQVIGRLTQATDHPVLLTFPEAGYLKGLVIRVGL